MRKTMTVLTGLLVMMLSLPAAALDLTDRQLEVTGTLNVSSARKVAKQLIELDAMADAPIYLMISAHRGSTQGVMLLADTIQTLKSSVVGIVQTEVLGGGAALAAFTDRVYIYPSAGMVFTELEYEGVSKPKPPKEGSKPKELTKEEEFLLKVREAYLGRFRDALAKRIFYKSGTLQAKFDEGGFAISAAEAVKSKVAHAVVDKITYFRLPETKEETKVTTTRKEIKTETQGDKATN